MSEPKDGVKKTQAAKKWIKGVTQLSSYEKYEIKDMVDGGANVWDLSVEANVIMNWILKFKLNPNFIKLNEIIKTENI